MTSRCCARETGVGPSPSLDLHHSTAHLPPRMHLDLYTDDQAGEVKRLLARGATEVHWDKRPPAADYVILAEPEGNRFCVVDAPHKRSAWRYFLEVGAAVWAAGPAAEEGTS